MASQSRAEQRRRRRSVAVWLAIIPTATQNHHSNPHGDTESLQQSARSLSEKLKKNTQQAGYGIAIKSRAEQRRRRRSVGRLLRLGFTWCKAGSVPSEHGGRSRSAPSEPEAARRLGALDIFPSSPCSVARVAWIGCREEEEEEAWQARRPRPAAAPLSPLAAW